MKSSADFRAKNQGDTCFPRFYNIPFCPYELEGRLEGSHILAGGIKYILSRNSKGLQGIVTKQTCKEPNSCSKHCLSKLSLTISIESHWKERQSAIQFSQNSAPNQITQSIQRNKKLWLKAIYFFKVNRNWPHMSKMLMKLVNRTLTRVILLSRYLNKGFEIGARKMEFRKKELFCSSILKKKASTFFSFYLHSMLNWMF